MTHVARKAEVMQSRRKYHRKMDAVSFLLTLIFIVQLGMLCYFNFTQLKNHAGYDSSWNYLRSILMWKEKALISPNWYDDTNLQLDTHALLTSLLYGLTGDIWLSFGIGNTVMIALMLLFVWKILDRLDVYFSAKIIALNLVICPYLLNGYHVFNDLGYFSCLLSGASFYSLRALLLLMILYEFVRIRQEQKMGFLLWIICPGCLLCGFSSGVYLLVAVLVPCLAYMLEMTAITGEWKQLLRRENVFVYLCGASMMAGKWLVSRVHWFAAMDSTMTWTALTNLWNNFISMLLGYLKLMQVLPVSGDDYSPVMSSSGLCRVCGLAIVAVLVISVAWTFRRTLKNWTEKNGMMLLLCNLVLINGLMLSLCNASYGSRIFEERYQVIPFLTTVLMAALLLDCLGGKKLLSLMLSLGLAISIGLVDYQSDRNFLNSSNDAWRMEDIQRLAEEQNAGIVYVWGDDITVIARTLRAWDPNHIYKAISDEGGYYRHNWGDYLYLDTNEEYTGPTLLVTPREHDLISESVRAEYTLLDSLEYTVLDSTAHADVYVCDYNPHLW